MLFHSLLDLFFSVMSRPLNACYIMTVAIISIIAWMGIIACIIAFTGRDLSGEPPHPDEDTWAEREWVMLSNSEQNYCRHAAKGWVLLSVALVLLYVVLLSVAVTARRRARKRKMERLRSEIQTHGDRDPTQEELELKNRGE